MLHSQIVKEHIPVGGFIAYPNIQISALCDGNAGIGKAVQGACRTDYDGSALGVAADVFELFIQKDPVQISFGLARRSRIITREKAVQGGVNRTGRGIVQVGHGALDPAAGADDTSGKGSQYIVQGSGYYGQSLPEFQRKVYHPKGVVEADINLVVFIFTERFSF